MIRNPFKVLVCLAITTTLLLSGSVYTYSANDSSALPGVQADALSAQPGTGYSDPPRNTYSRRTRSYSRAPSYRPYRPYRPVTKVGPQPYCPPQQYCAPQTGCYGSGTGGLFSGFADFAGIGGLLPFPSIGIQPIHPGSFLPRPGCRQFEVFASLWYSKMNASTIVWGANGIGNEGTELDLTGDLNLPKYEYVPTYGAMFRLRKNWSVRYMFMPMVREQNSLNEVPGGFWFGNTFYPQFDRMYVKWWRYMHRAELVYDWAQTRYGVSSLFAGYSLYDDNLRVSTATQSRSRNRGFGLVVAGLSLNRLVADMCGGGKATLDCSWAMYFLEDYVGWDGHAIGRVIIPMNCGRYGYLEAGWRWVTWEMDKPSNADKTSLDGLTGSIGLVF